MPRREIILFLLIIAVLNMPLFLGTFSDRLIYLPQEVAHGQWWRLVTAPFVHLSLYHLVLDGAAFGLLYAQLAEKSRSRRIGYLLGIHAAVTLAVTFALPDSRAIGYCGLSGLAHGLMAIWCLERFGTCNPAKERLIAAGVFICLLTKSIYEVSAGHAFFESAHLGDVGVPVVASHLAGVIGAVMAYAVLNIERMTAFHQVKEPAGGCIFQAWIVNKKG